MKASFRDGASVAFAVSLAALVLSAFSFAAIHGESISARRTHNAGLWAGAPSTSGWGLSCGAEPDCGVVHIAGRRASALGRARHDSDARPRIHDVLDHDAMVRFDDPETAFKTVPTGTYLRTLAPSLTIVVVAVIMRLTIGGIEPRSWLYVWPPVGGLVIAVVGMTGTLGATAKQPDTVIPIWIAVVWSIICAVYAAALLIVLPPVGLL